MLFSKQLLRRSFSS